MHRIAKNFSYKLKRKGRLKCDTERGEVTQWFRGALQMDGAAQANE